MGRERGGNVSATLAEGKRACQSHGEGGREKTRTEIEK